MSGRFLPELPVAGAVVALGDQLGWVLGFPVQSGAELVAELTTGSGAPFRVRMLADVVLLERSGPSVFGVANNRLLVASSRAALEKLGAYVARQGAPSVITNQPVTLQLAPGAGPQLSAWAALRSQLWSQHLRQSLAEQRRALPGKPLGDPEVLFSKVEEQRASVIKWLGRVSGGRLACTLEKAGTPAAEVVLTGELKIADAPRLSNIACDALPLVPRQTTGYVMFDPAALSAADSASDSSGQSWAGVFVPGETPRPEAEAWSARVRPLSGPLMFGVAERAAFLSMGWNAELSELEALLSTAIKLPLLTHNLPSVFGNGQALSVRRDAGLLTVHTASARGRGTAADGPVLFAAGLAPGRAWFASAAEPVPWLSAVLAGSSAEPALKSIRPATCQRDLLLAAGLVTEHGEGRLQLVQDPDGLRLSAQVPWNDLLGQVRAFAGETQ
jgi:hypothetical protein